MSDTMKRLTSLSVALLSLCTITPRAQADIKLPALFSDHMVLQRDLPVPVWGWAEPGEEVTVTIAGQSQATRADPKGKWTVQLTGLKAGGPHTLTVKGKNTLTVNDVLIGEVWLGSGQSNMAMTVNRARDFEQERAGANLPQIRMFTVGSGPAPTEQADCQGRWLVCAPETVGGFSATAFFFGREIHRALGVPVGLINSSVGGTPIESWISWKSQEQTPELKPFLELRQQEDAKFDPVAAKAKYEKDLAAWKEAVKKAKAEGKTPPPAPRDPVTTRARKGGVGELFNGKIAPLVPYALRGVIWYQGEANSTPALAPFYRHQLPLLIQDWRARWGRDLPFAWVQLPNFDGAGRDWPSMREAMLHSLKIKATGMAITIDIGEAKDIHPQNKQEVGRRLTLWALGTVYGQKVAAASGPLPASHEVRSGEIVLSFQHTNGGLVAKGGELKGFVVAGEDRQWKPAQARIAGDKVIVSSPEVPKPVAARYAWENNPLCNLYNGAGLPASPFRTDDWK